MIVATSNEQAQQILSSRPSGSVALVISDIGREGNARAGLEGLESLREKELYTGPVIFYTLRPTSRQVEEAGLLKAEVTSSPTDLQAMVQRYLPTAAPPSSSIAS